MRFSVYQESQIGGRRINQDRMGYSFTRDALLMVLADGLGGHLLGEIAAQIAVQTVSREFQMLAKPVLRDPKRFLEESAIMAHRQIHRYADSHHLQDVPRTTLVVCLVQQGQAYWAHAGDSRFYLMRDKALYSRTRDHSQLEFLARQQHLPAAQRLSHPDRNKLFNCLGSPNMPLVNVGGPETLRSGDVLLVCSDGLWGSVEESVLVQKLCQLPVTQAVPELIQMGLRRAGAAADNTTALAVAWQ